MKQIFNKYIIIILSFYAFWILVLPFTFSKIVPIVCEDIAQKTNYRIEINDSKLKLSVLPKAKINANIKINNKINNDVIYINNFDSEIRLLPLLSGRFHINYINIKEINSNITFDNDIELDKDFLKNLSNLKVRIDKINIASLNSNFKQINIKDPAIYKAKNIEYSIKNKAFNLNLDSSLVLKNIESKLYIKLHLPQNNDIGHSIVDVKMNNINIEPIGEYLRQYLPKDLINMKGIIDIDINKQNLKATFNNVKFLMKDNAKSMIYPDILRLDSDFDLNNKIINFKNFNIKSKNIDTVLVGSISNYLRPKDILLDFNIAINHSRVEDFVSLLPPFVVEEFNIYKLKYYKFFGDVIGNLSLKGNIIEPDIKGTVIIKNGVLIKPIKNAKGAKLKLDFLGRTVAYDVEVPAGNSEYVWVKGDVELYNIKYSNMRIWSTQNVNLVTAEEKVVPLHEILNFVVGPVPIMDIKGLGNIDIKVRGNRADPHIWGSLNFKNVMTYFYDIPNLVLKNTSATLFFDDQNVKFDTSNGLVNGKAITINGNCNLLGKFDFDVSSSNQELAYLYRAIENSKMLVDFQKILPKFDSCGGLINLNLKVYGSLINFEDVKVNKNVFAKGKVDLLNNTIVFNGLKVHQIKGNINFDGMDAKAIISGLIGGSKLNIEAKIKNSIADLVVKIPRLNLADVLNSITEEIKSDISNVFVDAYLEYKGSIHNIEYDRIRFESKILGVDKTSKLQISNGCISLRNNVVKISDLNGTFANTNSSFKIDMDVDNALTEPNVNGVVDLKKFDLRILNQFMKYNFIPQEIKNIVFENGNINLNCKIRSNKINAYTDLGGINLVYTPLELPIKILNGSFVLKNNNLSINKLNVLADNMPILVDGYIDDLLGKQFFNLYVNSKPCQEFIDKYFNRNQIYPLKLKGDIVYYLRFKGVKDNYNLNSEINLAKDASIYHLGATVGDIENAIIINLNTKIIKQNILKIKEFSYDKVISSLGNKQTRLNMLKAKGGIEVYKDDLSFDDLCIKTQNPTDARIFNIIFRKPNIKQGQFTSDLKFNGRLSNPRVLGDFHIFETNIPFLDTTMKNITFKFKDKTIDISSKGEILGNDVAFSGVMKNKLTLPYYVEKAELYTQYLDLNYIIDKLKLSQAENYTTFASLEGFDLSSLVIKNIKLDADNIYLRNIVAKDFVANASLNERKILNVDNFKFNIASGVLGGSFNYNLQNNRTGLSIKAKDIDANDLTYALFDLDNQIYGDLTGNIKLSCVGDSFDYCMKTLNGKTSFNVINGRLPKLGSLEYLLKAGDIVKGGFTGFSLNNVVDLVTPLKTGNFSSIYGKIDIKDGIANDIEIATQGKNLSLYITGDYNFSSSIANLEVLGLLSQKITTMFGPIGNLSLNSLFNAIPGIDLSKNTRLIEQINKIPGIELSSNAFRKFLAEINGNINGDDFVTSFKWIN